jgi:UDP-N-acetylmuramate--alanine ligase
MYVPIKRIHLVGIGGTGMSGIAEVLINRHYIVSGSDIADSEVVARLRDLGATIAIGHARENLGEADLVVVSSAIDSDNPELQEAHRLGVPIVPRAEMLAELMRTRYGVAIAGAHGKTTTTSLVGALLAAGGLDPTVVVGGRIKSYGAGTRLGAGDFLVAEADESDGSFLMLSPSIVVVTNIDLEHVDHYGSLDAIFEAFRQFAEKVPFYGVAVLCADDPLVLRLAQNMKRRVITYGTAPGAGLVVTNFRKNGLASRFEVEGLGEFTLPLPGKHNALNAAAALAVGRELGIDVEILRRAVAAFEGVGRRFETVETRKGITLVDDYGHHPTEVRVVLETAREAWPERRIHCVFQPHRYTRTQALWRIFGSSFGAADRVWLLPIYPGGEREIPGVDSRLIFRALREAGHPRAELLDGKPESLVDRLMPEFETGDVVITLGAGDIWRLNRALARALGGAR